MTKPEGSWFTRRDLLKGTATLVIGAGAARLFSARIIPQSLAGDLLDSKLRLPSPESLDAWLLVHEDDTVTAFFGKTDLAQGVDTAIAQVVAEELDLPIDRVSVVMGDTGLTQNQGGLSASTACSAGARPLRNAAAEARRLLLEAGATYFAAAPSELSILDGDIYKSADPQNRISYGQLIAGRAFATKLVWNQKQGNFMDVAGIAKPKDPAHYRIVGQPIPRKDLPGKIYALTQFCHHVTLPGMLHGRMIRPPVANVVPVKFEPRSIAKIDGAQVVHVDQLIGVTAPTEWGAIQAAHQLKVEWSDSTRIPFPLMEELHPHIRTAAVVASNAANAIFGKQVAYDTAPTEDALRKCARVLTAEYELPFQSHARMAPSVGVADVTSDRVLIYSDAQKPHAMRLGLSKLLGVSIESIRVVWKPGPGSYGRSDADEAAFEAAILSRAVGRPVRVQWMRHEGHAWDPKAPAAVISLKAGLDPAGRVAAWYFRAKGFSGWDVAQSGANPGDTLAGMLMNLKRTAGNNFAIPEQSYDFPNAVRFWETIAPLQETASPLRTSHMRGPQEPQVQFAHESFIDEIAVATGEDPVAFRLRYLRDKREIRAVNAAADACRWRQQPSQGSRGIGDVLRGRGIAAGPMFGTYVAVACEVEIDAKTGRLWARRFTVAHDCGLAINPLGLRGTIEGNVMQGLSRTIWEEVQFDPLRVTSLDWNSYPICGVQDAPEAIEIILIEDRQQPPSGAGEATLVFVAAAVGNAVFDATGVRYRRLPLTPARLLESLNKRSGLNSAGQ